MKYSPTTNAFYHPSIHGGNIPADSVEISDGEHRALLTAQEQGKIIQPDENGRPVAVDPPAPLPPTDEELSAQARRERDRLMREVYDPAIMQTLRDHRSAVAAGEDTAAIDARIMAWDAFATALCDLTLQADFPHNITWPEAPSN